MTWFKDNFSAEPIQCPRGWGEVTFAQEFQFFPVYLSIERTCPIGGVESCAKCSHPVNPGLVEHLRTQLVELEDLRGSVLGEAEFRTRRRMIVEPWAPEEEELSQGTAMAALILGPLGVLATGAGWYLSAAVHLGFLGLAGGGLVLTSIAASMASISYMQRRRLPEPGDPPPGELPERTYQIETELARARDELSFFRELHEGGAPEEPEVSDPDEDGGLSLPAKD